MFDDIIKGKANEHEAPVPPDAWNNIVNRKKKRRFPFWWWSSALLLMLLGTAGYFATREGNKSNITYNSSKHSPAASQDATANTSAAGSNTDKAAVKENSAVSEETKTVAETDVKKTSGGISVTIQNSDAGEIAAENKSADKRYSHRNRKKTKEKITMTQASPAPAEDDSDDKVVAGTLYSNSNNNEEEKIKDIVINEEKNKTENKIAATETAETGSEKKKEESKKTQSDKKITTLTKQPQKRGWFLDAGIAPLLPLKQFAAPVSYIRTQFSNNTISEYSGQLSKTTIAPSVAFSFTLRRELGKKWQAGIGLQYLVVKENISIEGVEKNTISEVVKRLVNGPAGPALVDDTITTVTEGNRTISAVNSYHIFSIPVFAQYNILQNNRWSLAATGGVYINFAGTYHNTINDNASSPLLPVPAENTGITKIDIFTGLRLGKMIGNKIELFAMPSLRLGAGHYNFKNSLVNRNMKQACVGFGISYKIK